MFIQSHFFIILFNQASPFIFIVKTFEMIKLLKIVKMTPIASISSHKYLKQSRKRLLRSIIHFFITFNPLQKLYLRFYQGRQTIPVSAIFSSASSLFQVNQSSILLISMKTGQLIIILMQLSYHYTPNFRTSDEAALYYNTLSFPYQCFPETQQFFTETLKNSFLMFSMISFGRQGVKQQLFNQRPTDDMESIQATYEADLENFDQRQTSLFSKDGLRSRKLLKEYGANKKQKNEGHAKNLKKNIESNLINNSFSFLSSGCKSYRITQELFNDEVNKIKIFYTFANIIKKVNGKYLNKMTIKQACEIIPKQALHRSLSKSTKRLQILSIKELRLTIRKLIFYYMRGSESILPLLTSKKMCRIALKEYMNHRRQICRFLTTMLKEQE